MSQEKNRRSIINTLMHSGVQGRLIYTALIIALVTAIPFIAGMFYITIKLADVMQSVGVESEAHAIGHMLFSVSGVVLLLWLLSLVGMYYFTAVQVHKIAGPIQVLEKHVERHLAGDFNQPISLRKTDELQGFAEKLESLRQKYKSRA